MRCHSCGQHTNRIRVIDDVEYCTKCAGLSRLTGVAGILTRNSQRIDYDRSKHEADMIQPHKYDKASKQFTVNDDFVKQYPDKAKNFFTSKELKKAGYPKLAKEKKSK